jgi:hypothetical protein
MRRLLLFVSLAAGLACQGSAPPGEYFRFQNQGKICAFPEGTDPGNAFLPSTTVTFQANQTASITVMAPTCLSSSCSKERQAECTAVLAGNVIQVSSTASFRQEGQVCTDDCGALVARCTSPPLPAGTYFLQHGADRVVVTIPSMGPTPCAGKTF